tara:strand:+ start:851 stop:1378 length:528 start_codon:yes stop_codon:yes gene_type:complete
MATTTSVATSTNAQGTDIGAIDAWSSSDNTRNNPFMSNALDDITLTFGNLNVPSGATINGLEITVEGQGNNFAATPLIFLNNGTDNGDSLAPSAAFGKSDATVTYGGSTTRWGLEWSATTANDVIATLDMSTISSGRVYFDHLFMTVYYEEAAVPGVPVQLISGTIELTSGQIII